MNRHLATLVRVLVILAAVSIISSTAYADLDQTILATDYPNPSPSQWGVIDPCPAERARLDSLLSALAQFEAIPGSKCEQRPAVCERQGERIAQWHQQHDQEVDQLEGQLASPACQLMRSNTANLTWARDICHNQILYHFPANQEPRYEWTPIFSSEFDNPPVGISGTALLPQLSDDDIWFTHPFGFDWEFFIAPDAPYSSLLAPSNTTTYCNDPTSCSDPNLKYLKPDGEYQPAIRHGEEKNLFAGSNAVHGVLGVETDRGLVPEEYRVQDGDRVAVFGRWIVDCGHDDFHTEIHPPLLLAAARDIAGGDITHSTVLGRPYLVSQEFATGGLVTHLLNEIWKAISPPGFITDTFGLNLGVTDSCPWYWPDFVPCTMRLEAHPKIMSKPFSGTQIINYFVRPLSSGVVGDRLVVRHHFTVRDGVSVFLYQGDFMGYHAPPNTVGVLIEMRDDLYSSPNLPPQNNGLGPNFLGANEGPDCSVSPIEIDRLKPEIGDILSYVRVGIAGLLGPLGAPFNAIVERGIKTDCYDPPLARSLYDSQVTGGLIENVTGTQVAFVDNGQPFPIYGWLDVGWERLAKREIATVTFLNVKVIDDSNPGQSVNVWFDFKVNGQQRRFPLVGTHDLPVNSLFNLSQSTNYAVTVEPGMWGTLSVQVVGNGLNAFNEDACDPNRSSGCPRPSPPPPQKVDRTYDGTSHFGEGIHTERSTSDFGETFEVTYRIDVSPLCPSCVVQQPGGGGRE